MQLPVGSSVVVRLRRYFLNRHERYHAVRFLVAVITTVALLPLCAPACCQQPARPTAELIVLVQPAQRDVFVAVTYSHSVRHSDAAASLKRLANGLQSRISALHFADVRVPVTTSAGRVTITQTEASCYMIRPRLYSGGGFVLQPFVQAWSAWNRVELLFLAPSLADFTGLRSYDSQVVRITLLRSGGPYHYLVEVKEHHLPIPELPLVQTQATAPTLTVQEIPVRSSAAAAAALAVTVAAGVGLVVLAGLLLVTRLRHT